MFLSTHFLDFPTPENACCTTTTQTNLCADTLLKLQIRFKKLDEANKSYDHYTKKVAHLVSEREKRKARGKGEDAVHIEKMARNEEKLRAVRHHLGVGFASVPFPNANRVFDHRVLFCATFNKLQTKNVLLVRLPGPFTQTGRRLSQWARQQSCVVLQMPMSLSIPTQLLCEYCSRELTLSLGFVSFVVLCFFLSPNAITMLLLQSAKVPYLNQVYHSFSNSLRLVFNSALHETEAFGGR